MDWHSPLSELFKTPKTKTCSLLNQAGFNIIDDLLKIFPKKIAIIPQKSSFDLAKHNEIFNGQGEIFEIQKKYNFSKSKGSYKKNNIIVSAAIKDYFSNELMDLIWFNCYPAQLKKLEELKLNKANVNFQGKVTFYKNKPQIISPKISCDEINENILIEYPNINGLTHKDIKQTYDRIPLKLWENIKESLPLGLISEKNILTKQDWAQIIHGKFKGDLTEKNLAKAHYRTVYESSYEKIYRNIKIREEFQKNKAPVLVLNENDSEFIFSLFPFKLTSAQERVIKEIQEDLKYSKPMARLLQGDVGSGKTCIAIISACVAIKNGYQVALMCPTESLAQQHFLEIKSYLSKFFKIEIILGHHKESKKSIIRKELKEGIIDLIIGTHSLIQESIEFKKLGLSIIDEQHKFGVNQKRKLIEKSFGSHSLYISATPIPRALKLAQFGQLDLSVIDQLPPNKKDIKSKLITKEYFKKYLSFLKTRLSMGEQAYIVVPLINGDNNEIYLKSIFKKFRLIFPEYNIQEYHGEQTIQQKEDTLLSFSKGDINILIATSIIEVGINVINATVISIFRPERFGLSSLHQLRGRVGRGGRPGFCFVIQDNDKWTEQAKQRIQTFIANNNGFFIAEEDLRIRGEGDIMGTKQSGTSPQKSFDHFYQIDKNFFSNVKKDVLKYLH